MSMRLTNILLAILAAVLLVLIYFSMGDVKAPVRQQMFSSDLNSYQTIEIKRQGEPTLICRREQGLWRIDHAGLAGVMLRANEWKLQQIVDQLSRVEYRALDGSLDYAQFDLKQPLVVLTLDGREIGFGNTNPINRNRYISLENRVYLIKDDVYRHVIDDWYEFVDKAFIDNNKKIVSITMNDVKVYLSESRRWVLQAPKKENSLDQLHAFVDDWQHAQAVFLTTAEERSFIYAIDIVFEDGGTRHYQAALENDGLIVVDQRSKLEYHFSTATTNQLIQFQ